MSNRHRSDGALVFDFAKRHGLCNTKVLIDYPRIDRLLGFVSKGRASRRWEENGIPTHVHTLMAYVDKFGTELAEQVAAKRDAVFSKAAEANPNSKHYYVAPVRSSEFKVPAETIVKFREKHSLTQPLLDRMLGFNSRGRTVRTWEEKGAPAYAEVLLSYIEEYGAETALDQIEVRGQKLPKTAYESAYDTVE